MHSSLFADLAIDAQRTIAANAEHQRQAQEAAIALGRTGLRQRMGRALISMGEHVGGIHRDAISSLTNDAMSTSQPATAHPTRAC